MADVVDNWVVLDDEWFGDFAKFGITEHWVRPSFYGKDGGLQEEHVQQAIKILNGELNEERTEAEEENMAEE